jgi:hypothetical protein
VANNIKMDCKMIGCFMMGGEWNEVSVAGVGISGVDPSR